MKHVFIYDPKCFHEQQWKMDGILDNIGQYFRGQTNPDFTTQFTRYPREAIGIIRKRIDEAGEGDIVRIYAIGEEEILFDCLNGVVGFPSAGFPSIELAIMFYGKKTNDFLRIFGETKADTFRDLSAIAAAPSLFTDVINVGNNYALNGCFVGLIAATTIQANEMKMKLGKKFGKFAFVRWFMTLLSNLFLLNNPQVRNQHYDITIDGQDYSGNYSSISIANGPYYGGKKIAAREAVPDDGLLDVALLKATTPTATLVTMSKFSRGKTFANCVRLQAKKIKIQSDDAFWVQLDGEFQQDTDITFEVVPNAVQIVVPKDLTYPRANS